MLELESHMMYKSYNDDQINIQVNIDKDPYTLSYIDLNDLKEYFQQFLKDVERRMKEMESEMDPYYT